MATINQLPLLSTLVDGDQFVVWSVDNGDSRRVPYGTLKADLLDSVTQDWQSEVATLTNKTIALGSNALSGTLAQFNTACTDADFASTATAQTLTNKTIALGSNTLTGTLAQFNAACTDADFQPTTYTPAGTGAVTRTVQDKLRDTVNAKDFGVVGDGVADDYAALQAALNFAMANNKAVILPKGRYKITNSLMISPWNGSAYPPLFVSVSLIGETYAYADGVSAFIEPTFNDKPAIIIQNARGVIIQNIGIIGQNKIKAAIAANYTLMMTEANFVTGGARDSRYSPYAGICIDPFGTSVPPDGGYPGMSAYYAAGATGSARLIIDNVRIEEFVVGVMITPNQVTQNAEDIYFRAAFVGYCKVNVANGQSQARCVHWHGGNSFFSYYGFDTRSYGVQQGSLPFIDGANMAGKYLFNANTNFGTPAIIKNIHAESFASIGSFYSPATRQQPVTFISCEFAFADFSIGGSSRAYADSVFSSSAPTKFIGCDFNNIVYNGVLRMYTNYPIDFDSCTFQTEQNELQLWRSNGINGLQFQDMTFKNCVVIDDTARGGPAPTVLTDDMVVFDFVRLNRRYAPFGGRVRMYDSATNAQRVYWNANTPLSQTERIISATQAVTVGANGIATMTVPDGTLIRTGDVIFTITAFSPELSFAGSTYNPLGVVTSVVGNDVTFSGIPQNFTSGTYAIRNAWWPRYHLASTGDVTSGSADILNVTNPTTWVVGNKIRGTGIPVGAYVTNVSGTTVTISKAATATNVGVRLFDADMHYVAGTAL